jgi:regulator of ribosome biosynthesis
LVSKLEGSNKRTKHGDGDVLNVRKAIRAVSKGKGPSALVKGHSMKRNDKGTKGKSKR